MYYRVKSFPNKKKLVPMHSTISTQCHSHISSSSTQVSNLECAPSSNLAPGQHKVQTKLLMAFSRHTNWLETNAFFAINWANAIYLKTCTRPGKFFLYICKKKRLDQWQVLASLEKQGLNAVVAHIIYNVTILAKWRYNQKVMPTLFRA